jgi:hypothetical protein
MYVVILVGPVDTVEREASPQGVVVVVRPAPNLPLAAVIASARNCG